MTDRDVNEAERSRCCRPTGAYLCTLLTEWEHFNLILFVSIKQVRICSSQGAIGGAMQTATAAQRVNSCATPS